MEAEKTSQLYGKISKDTRVVLIASGPSLTQEDVNACRGKAIVGVVNDAYRMAPWADLLYAADARWWNHHQPVFAGEKWICRRLDKHGCVIRLNEKAMSSLSVKWVPGQTRKGLSLKPGLIHFGGNSGFQILNFFILLGAKKIGLLAYDMKVPAGNPEKEHFFGKHPQGFNSPANNFLGWIRNFERAAKQLQGTDISVVNLSRDSALNCFPRMSIESFLNV